MWLDSGDIGDVGASGDGALQCRQLSQDCPARVTDGAWRASRPPPHGCATSRPEAAPSSTTPKATGRNRRRRQGRRLDASGDPRSALWAELQLSKVRCRPDAKNNRMSSQARGTRVISVDPNKEGLLQCWCQCSAALGPAGTSSRRGPRARGLGKLGPEGSGMTGAPGRRLRRWACRVRARRRGIRRCL